MVFRVLASDGEHRLALFVIIAVNVLPIVSAITCFFGKLSLLETAGIINFSKGLLTNDSGLMHIAVSVKRPVIAIFGSTTKELGFFPFRADATVIENFPSISVIAPFKVPFSIILTPGIEVPSAADVIVPVITFSCEDAEKNNMKIRNTVSRARFFMAKKIGFLQYNYINRYKIIAM